MGKRVFAPDGKFITGFDPRNGWDFHMVGLSGHGVTAPLAVGCLAAKLNTGDAAEHSGTFALSRLLSHDALGV